MGETGRTYHIHLVDDINWATHSCKTIVGIISTNDLVHINNTRQHLQLFTGIDEDNTVSNGTNVNFTNEIQ